MSADEILKASERSAVLGKRVPAVFAGVKKRKSLGAIGLITLMLIILTVMVSFGNLIPSAILEQLIVATDVQYADAVESKMLVFQQALETGTVPENTIKRLRANGIEVNGDALVFKDEKISAADFINKIHSNAEFYNAFNLSTYDRAAYYYDEAAEEVFKKIGTTRNNYTESSNFGTVMSDLVGEGSSINVNNVGLFEREDEEGEKYTEYDTVGDTANSGGGAAEFISRVAENNLAEDGLTATLDATDALNTADTISKEQKSSIFFMALMENISKMKAGQGNSSKINAAMNFLYDERESSVVDTSSGEVVTTKGSALESPSFYAILTGTQIKEAEVANYASDRILKTVENKVGVSEVGQEVKEGTITSTSTKIKGLIGRFLEIMGEEADAEVLSSVTPTINNSMVENNFDSIGGVYAGELLVEGAVNVGKELAKASGATPGDAGAVQSYARLDDTIIALDAEADRINRSPFDITSKNTFLGSIFYKLGVSIATTHSGIGGVFKTIGSVMSSIITPPSYADDDSTKYLSNFGNCETINSIGAVGSVGCSEIATFDTSTLNDPFHNEEFLAFMEENTTMEGDQRVIKKDSTLADFIKYNNERITPIGVMDGGILESLKEDFVKIPLLSNVIKMIEIWLDSNDEEKNIATSRSFVNSSENGDWENYKYAQRYVSLARATSVLRQYDGDDTAYNDLRFFEGNENPVIAFINNYYTELAQK